jgi:hypothetical protein
LAIPPMSKFTKGSATIVMLLGLSLFPSIALAGKKPPEVIPALENAKVIGVYCTKSDYDYCHVIVGDLQSHLAQWFEVIRLTEHLGADGKISFPDIGRCDLEIDVKASMTYGAYSDPNSDDTINLGATIFDNRTGKAIKTILAHASSNSQSNYIFDMRPGIPDNHVWEFIMLHSGRAEEACRTPMVYLQQSGELTGGTGNAALRDAGALRRFQRLCEKNGVK